MSVRKVVMSPVNFKANVKANLPVMLAVLLTLGGCGWFGGSNRYEPTGPSLAELIADLPAAVSGADAAPVPDRDSVIAAYQRIHGEIPDPARNHAVGKRLADLQMSVGEDLDVAGVPMPYHAAIELYESLLDQPGSTAQDQILYQLARGHDLAGDTDRALGYLDRLVVEHPASDYRVEARFRRAEIAFSRERYQQAGDDYGYVVTEGAGSAYWLNASYMRGWSLFKLSELEAGLASFYSVIDSLMADAGETGTTLPATGRELLQDTFRVITLALGYLDGAATLAEQMQDLGRPGWQYLAYQALAGSQHANARYLDSVATWQTFIDRNPLDPRAPSAHLGMIETLVEADFPSEVLPKKELFVRGYGIHSAFWDTHPPQVRAAYADELQQFLQELAQHHHAAALESGERTAFLDTARWYEELVETFADAPGVAETLFLLGEAYTNAEEHSRAVAAYQRVMREHPGYASAHEAGYAAILGLEALATAAASAAASGDASGAASGAADGVDAQTWQRLKIDAQIEFAYLFAEDPRAPVVQADAADGLFRLAEHREAVELAGNLLQRWPDADAALRRTALLVRGHGLFELGDYAASEHAYQALLHTALEPPLRATLTERLLAAVYRQGEQSERDGDADAAVAHFLRLQRIAPDAELAIRGHFDAVAVTESAGRAGDAAQLLTSFRDRYPDHALGHDAARRLAALHESTGATGAAVRYYVELADTDADPEVRRQSRYRAAEIYLEQQDARAALEQFEAYVRAWPQPVDLHVEALHQLGELNRELGDLQRHRHWQAEMIALHRSLGSAASDRAAYLAAAAQYDLAVHERARFDAVALVAPLQRSLAEKQQALQRTVRAFEAAAGYQVGEFSTASTYQIGDLFAALSESIIASERPRGLSELELEQYEILLEEQAFPFEEQAISLHEINMRRSWQGSWDPWIERSFSALGRLMPARFDKPELEVVYVDTIH